jgi:signal transduction histidine kinase
VSFDRLELLESSSRLYRPDPARLRGELELRARLLNRLLLGAGAIALEYLVLGLAGFVTGQFFPYDAIELLLVVAACFWLAKRGSTSTALVLLLVVYLHFASSVISHYGIASPAVALLLPSILACGLVGGYFLLTWTLICGVLIVYLGWAHDHFRWSADLVRAILLWWAQLAAVGWLVQLFAGHLGKLLHRYAVMVEERNRVARDIHDTLAQGFTGVIVQLNAATEMLSADPTRAREHVATARNLARTSLQEARRSVWALRPIVLEREELAQVLERSGRTLTAATGIDFVIEKSGDAPTVSAEAEWEVLRIGQEAVANAVRHSGCRRITLRLDQDKGALRLEVEDDGKGGIIMDEAGATRSGGFGAGGRGVGGLGLLGMHERAARAGGRLEIQSPVGGPTRIVLVIPSKLVIPGK